MPPEPPAIGISMDIDKHVDRRRVLFLCTGNAARSQMAEGLLRRYGSDSFDVQSAGTEPADIIHPLAVRAMDEIGVDISHQRPKDLWQFVAERWDFVITTCDRANENCPMFPGAQERIHWSFKDPAAAVRDEILTRVRLFASVQARTLLEN